MLKYKKLSNTLFIGIFIFTSLQLTTACQIPQNHTTKSDLNSKNTTSKTGKLWSKLRGNFRWQHPYNNSQVASYIKKYKKEARNLTQISKQASPYISHVVCELEKNNLPGELAILPIIESEYKPQATSAKGASGIWQLTRDTARGYGIKQDGWYDGRRDVTDSTRAAIRHIKDLNVEFKGDWLLTLAAYNAGAGRVRQAIRKNQRLGKATDFWSLPLPKETKHFVPKILALAYIIKNPKSIGLQLASVSDAPYFAKVEPGSQIDLRVAADLAEIPFEKFKQLNHAYTSHSTHPNGPQQIYLPTYAISTFNNNLKNTVRTKLVKFKNVNKKHKG